MALPGHRRTSSHKRLRASHFALTAKTAAKCGKCGKAVHPHRACAFCGTYKGRSIINVAKRTSRSTKKTGKK